MHQLPRGTSRTSRPTASPVDRSEPTGEFRDPTYAGRYTESGQGSGTEQRGEDADMARNNKPSQSNAMTGHSREAVTKLNQIVQVCAFDRALLPNGYF